MRYKGYAARRRGISFGGHHDFDADRLNQLNPHTWSQGRQWAPLAVM
jgi:hypothetical protein